MDETGGLELKIYWRGTSRESVRQGQDWRKGVSVKTAAARAIRATCSRINIIDIAALTHRCVVYGARVDTLYDVL